MYTSIVRQFSSSLYGTYKSFTNMTCSLGYHKKMRHCTIYYVHVISLKQLSQRCGLSQSRGRWAV